MTGFNPEVALTLLAGWITGGLVGLLDTGILMVALSRTPGWQRWMPGLRVSLPIFGIVAVNAMLFGWTLVGLGFGALYLGTTMPAYAFGVGAGWLGLAGLYVVVRGVAHRGELQVVFATALLAVLCFGGLLPLLASRI